MKFYALALAATAVGSLIGASAQAAVTFSFSSGTRAASAKFEISGSNLVVTLTNTSTFDCLVPTDMLTAVFFNVSGSPLSLGRVSAIVAGGSAIVSSGSLPSPATDPGPNGIGGEWAYLGGMSGPHSTSYGISSTGMGLFGPGDRFSGANLQGPDSPDGVQYGIASAGDNPSTGNGGISGSAFIKNSAIFTLSGLPVNFSLTQLKDIWFQYGTALDEPEFQSDVPAPGALALIGLGGLIASRRRRD